MIENKPYIIAELNSSHNGNMDTAISMIDSAKACGCDCVKFQSWSTDTLYSDEYYKNNRITKKIINKLSLNEEQLQILSDYCKNVGIDFSSTPYSKEEVDFLVKKAKASFIKISSMEINNIPFLQYIGEKEVPIIMSTGMSSLDEIVHAVKTLENSGAKDICILHCVSIYPAAIEAINLNNIKLLQDTFPNHIIGYSDHTLGHEIAVASVALGATVVEKHFTLDNSKMGMDNNMAIEPDEMKQLVLGCRNVYKAMGKYNRIVSSAEMQQAQKMRRSVIAKRDLFKGEVISSFDLEAKRPGDGLEPAWIEKLQGKTVNTNIPKGYKIKLSDIED